MMKLTLLLFFSVVCSMSFGQTQKSPSSTTDTSKVKVEKISKASKIEKRAIADRPKRKLEQH